MLTLFDHMYQMWPGSWPTLCCRLGRIGLKKFKSYKHFIFSSWRYPNTLMWFGDNNIKYHFNMLKSHFLFGLFSHQIEDTSRKNKNKNLEINSKH